MYPAPHLHPPLRLLHHRDDYVRLQLFLRLQCFDFLSPSSPRGTNGLRRVYSIIAVSIAGQHKFYDTLSNFLGVLGYWCAAWISVLVVEHLYFRHGDFHLYDISVWKTPRALPPGIAALTASVLSFGLVIPCMDQVWFTGPIAKYTGDIGFEVAFVLTAILYVPFRILEKRWFGV